MRNRWFLTRSLLFVGSIVSLSFLNTATWAGVIYYSDKSSFESQGSIQSRVDFVSYGTGVSVVGTGTSIGGITRAIERRSHGLILAWSSDWGSPILRRLRFYVVASNGVVACPPLLLKQLPITLQKLQTLVPIAASITR